MVDNKWNETAGDPFSTSQVSSLDGDWSPQETKNQFKRDWQCLLNHLEAFLNTDGHKTEHSAFIGLILLLKLAHDRQQPAHRASPEGRACLQWPAYISQTRGTKSQVLQNEQQSISSLLLLQYGLILSCRALCHKFWRISSSFHIPNMPEELMAPLVTINEGIFSLVNKTELFNIITIPHGA